MGTRRSIVTARLEGRAGRLRLFVPTRPLPALALWCALLLSHPARPAAAESTPRDLTDLSLEELLDVRIPAVYGASKFEQKVTEAPASVTIVTADEIRIHGYRTLAEILQSVRGFYVSYDRNYSYLGVRGFSRPGDYNTRVLLLVDGHRLNENIYGSALIGTEGFLDVDLIERVEIIRGPSSSLYGTNAFFAVVSIVTRRGADLQGTEVSGGAASYDTYRTRLSYGSSSKSGVETSLSGSFYNSGGQSLFYREFDSPATNNGVALRSDDDRSYSFLGKLAIQGFTLEAGHSSREKGIPTASYGDLFNDRRSRTTDMRSFADLEYVKDLETGLRMMGRAYVDRYAFNGDYVADYPPVTINKDRVVGEWWGLEGQISATLGRSNTLTGGVELRENIRQDQLNFDDTPYALYLDDHRRSHDWSLYLQDEIRFGEKILVNLGVRHDHYSTFGGTTNPRLAFIYRPARRWAVKLLYGTAFRAPNAYELYYSSPGSQEANLDLNPERLHGREIVLDAYLGSGTRLSASIFSNRILNLINQEVDPSNGLLVFRNQGEVESHGLEAEVEQDWKGGPACRLAYAFQKTTDEGTRAGLSNSPRHLIDLDATWPLPGDRLQTGLAARYVSARANVRGGFTGSYTVVNLTLVSRKVAKGLDLSASVYNLLDRSYSDPGSIEHLQDSIAQDGRNFALKLTYGF